MGSYGPVFTHTRQRGTEPWRSLDHEHAQCRPGGGYPTRPDSGSGVPWPEEPQDHGRLAPAPVRATLSSDRRAPGALRQVRPHRLGEPAHRFSLSHPCLRHPALTTGLNCRYLAASYSCRTASLPSGTTWARHQRACSRGSAMLRSGRRWLTCTAQGRAST